MIKNGQAEHPRVFNRATHDLVILHTVSVIRDRDNSGSNHRPVWSQFLSGEALRDRTRCEDIDIGARLRFLANQGDCSSIVCHRVRIRHANNTRETTCRRCARSGGNRLLLRLAWLPEMHVHIDQAWRHDKTRCVYDFGFGCLGFACRTDRQRRHRQSKGRQFRRACWRDR